MRWLVVTAAAVGLGMIVQSWTPPLLVPIVVAAWEENDDRHGALKKPRQLPPLLVPMAVSLLQTIRRDGSSGCWATVRDLTVPGATQ
jgi:hypothetical protein